MNPFRSSNHNPDDPPSPAASASEPSPKTAAEEAVEELVESLDQQRLYREVTLALRTGLRDARADFSFLRLRGLLRLLKFLRSVAESDDAVPLFCRSQSVPDLQ
ncbi:hypothetical protein AKJ16_DCAP16701 [Drosera capensis]